MKKKYEKVDYVFVSDKKKKEIQPEPTKRLVRHKMIGTTSIEQTIDKNYQPLVVAGRYGQAID